MKTFALFALILVFGVGLSLSTNITETRKIDLIDPIYEKTANITLVAVNKKYAKLYGKQVKYDEDYLAFGKEVRKGIRITLTIDTYPDKVIPDVLPPSLPLACNATVLVTKKRTKFTVKKLNCTPVKKL